MRTETINIYTIDELSDKAKQKAHEKWLQGENEYFWASENRASLDAFEQAYPIIIKDWEVSLHRHSYVRIELDLDDHYDEITEMTGLRLHRWLINNYWHKLFEGKYYGKLVNTFKDGTPIPVSKEHPNGTRHVKRYSRVLFEPADLTGYCMDFSLTHPLREFIKKPDNTSTLLDLMQACVDSWVEDYIKDMEYQESFEYFIDHAQANEYEYTANGDMY